MNTQVSIADLPLSAPRALWQAVRVCDRLVGVSNECDFPAAAKTKPVVVKSAPPLEKMSLCKIDIAVTECIGSGQNL